MAYIRRKERKGKYLDGVYYHVVESHRDENGKPRQRTIAYLGSCPTVEEALKVYTAALVRNRCAFRDFTAHWQDQAEYARKAYQRKWYARRLERAPQIIAELERAIENIRTAAAALDINDPEALLLPGTAARAEVEQEAEAQYEKANYWDLKRVREGQGS